MRSREWRQRGVVQLLELHLALQLALQVLLLLPELHDAAPRAEQPCVERAERVSLAPNGNVAKVFDFAQVLQ